jgi:dihydroorotate dehydrogenase electron transfer subunit
MPKPPQTTNRGRFDAIVLRNDPVCREHWRLVLGIDHSQGFGETAPGQFIQLACGPSAPSAPNGRSIEWQPGQVPPLQQRELVEPQAFLRRPFSLAGRRDTADHTELQVIHRVVGLGTSWLSGLAAGDSIDLIGPLGNRFTAPPGRSIGLLVGGGVGLPPMFYLAQMLSEAGWAGVGFIGATTADLLPIHTTTNPPAGDGQPALCVGEFAEAGFHAVVTTNDGSMGMNGLITDGLGAYLKRALADLADQAVVFTCGPHAMMAAVARLAGEYGIPAQVCMEQAMACGMGTCQSCVLKTRENADPHGHLSDGTGWRYRLACTDGPVFDADSIIW